MEIIKSKEKLRRDKTPSPNDLPKFERPFRRLREPDKTEYLWLCPLDSCRRTVRMQYRNDEPLPCCMGGPKPHVKQLLVCENYDIYRECFDRWIKGEDLGRPIIYPRNYYRFPVLARGDIMKDLSELSIRDRM